MRQALTRKSVVVRRYRRKQQELRNQEELRTQELQRKNKELASQYNLDFLFKTAPKSVYDEHGHIILDPDNEADRRWMED